MNMRFKGITWAGSCLLDICDPDPAQIQSRDIARGLSRKARFGGHTRDDLPPYSVAFHSLFCEAVADQLGLPVRVRLQALLHDAPEYILGDMVTPVKAVVTDYGPLEVGLWNAIARRFSISNTLALEVHEIDRLALDVERFHLVPPGAWLPEPVVPDDFAEMADRWMDFTLRNEKAHGPSFSAALFLSRLNALLDAHAQDAGA